MNILIDNTGMNLPNMGDAAQCQVAVERLGKLWPTARITVITDNPDLLAIHCPTAHPVPASGRIILTGEQVLLGRAHKCFPMAASALISQLEKIIINRFPRLTLFTLRMKWRCFRSGLKMEAFLDALLKADLVVIGGGGDFYEALAGQVMNLSEVMEWAIRFGKPVVMVGQGIGRLQSYKLRKRAKKVFPPVNVICLRETRTGLPSLYSLGVSPERIVVTGDDAIELAYTQRPTELGDAIGVNLRVASYSEVNESHIKVIRSALHTAAQKYHASLIPAPIAFNKGGTDSDAIRELLAGYDYDDSSDGGQALDCPRKVIQQIGLCRLVVTGSYHAGVFALSQGIPVVGLVKSQYYVDKFLGLADQFQVGCEVVFLDADNLLEEVMMTIDKSWESAQHVRPKLLDAAERQVKAGHVGYHVIYENYMGRAQKRTTAQIKSRSPIMSRLGGILRRITKPAFRPPDIGVYDRQNNLEFILSEFLFKTDIESGLKEWTFHDEYQNPLEITFDSGLIKFEIQIHSNDEWGYIFLDPERYNWRNISWQLRFRKDTAFREFAFNFRYRDFDNRYRYRFEDNDIHFDKKVGGKWYNRIDYVPFPLELGVWYDLRIDMYEDTFRCYVNDTLMMENCDGDLSHGSICIILWEDDGKTKVSAEVGPMAVQMIREKEVSSKGV